ncbi:DUF1659 domain-containing protein [Enterococcus olivae]
MKAHNQTKLTVQLAQDGEEKMVKQTFANVIADSDEADILALGDIIAELAPETVALESVIETVEFEYNK